MELSDKVKIALLISIPAVFFTLLFTLAIIYRKYYPKRPPTQHVEWGHIVSPRPFRRPSTCDECAHHAHTGFASTSTNMATAGSSSTTLQPSSSESDMVHRKSSTVQPHFAEKTTIIRRVSHIPGEPDQMQRVNSVASTLHQEADPESDTLPYGGRKSSMGSMLSYGSIKGTQEGQVAMGERRPSVLMDPMQCVMDVRRVSIGGQEDVVRVRSASQSSVTLGSSVEHARIVLDETQEVLPSPPLSSSHPFSATHQSKKPQIGSVAAFRLKEAPKGAPKKTFRPDSLTLIKQKVSPATPNVISAEGQPPTCISTIPLKSPYEGFSPDSDQGTAKIFEAWRGFPSKDDTPAIPSSGVRPDDNQPVLSPKTPAVDPPSIPLPISPSPLPAFEVFPVVPPCDTSPRPTTDAMAEPKPGSTPKARQDTVAPGPTPRSASSKITYLADVVRENEERKKRERADASSIVAIASLEDRPRSSVN